MFLSNCCTATRVSLNFFTLVEKPESERESESTHGTTVNTKEESVVREKFLDRFLYNFLNNKPKIMQKRTFFLNHNHTEHSFASDVKSESKNENKNISNKKHSFICRHKITKS